MLWVIGILVYAVMALFIGSLSAGLTSGSFTSKLSKKRLWLGIFGGLFWPLSVGLIVISRVMLIVFGSIYMAADTFFLLETPKSLESLPVMKVLLSRLFWYYTFARIGLSIIQSGITLGERFRGDIDFILFDLRYGSLDTLFEEYA